MEDLDENKIIEETYKPVEEEDLLKESDDRRRPNGSWVGALILIFLGIIFLLKELGLPLLENWWALFFAIPAVASFGSAWNHYQRRDKQVTSGVMGSLIGGIVLTFLMFIFLFRLEWSYMWPVFLIVIGVLVFISSFLRRE
jgi:drug/metabolite transporter (DMT)-like permease